MFKLLVCCLLTKKPGEFEIRQAFFNLLSLLDFELNPSELCLPVNQNLIIISFTKHKFLQLVLNMFE